MIHHVFNIYLHLWLQFMVNIDKYSSPILHLRVKIQPDPRNSIHPLSARLWIDIGSTAS